jgi:hypothetical protein
VTRRRHASLDRRTLLRTTAGAFGVAIAGGAVAASTHDIDVIFGDAAAAPGQSVTLPLDLEPANDPSAEVGAYDIEVTYDETVLSFDGASGVDLADPTVNEPESGRLTAIAGQVTGEPVPLTAATFTFTIDTDATPGTEATVALTDANSQFKDPTDDVTFESQAGTVSVGGAFFEVGVTSTNAPVQEGETLTVETLVENVGTEEATQTVELLDFAGNSVDSEQLTLQAGTSQSIDLTWETTAGDAGEDEITVESADDTATAIVEITAVPDVRGSLSDETNAPGAEVTVTFSVDPESDDSAVVGGYDVEIDYDDSVIAFSGATGIDLPDPTVSEPSPGTVTATASQSTGDPVPLTPAEFTFTIDGDATDGEVATVSFVSADSELTDPTGQVPTAFEDGSVTVNEDGPLVGYQVGDVNTDDERSIVDAVLIQQHLAGMNPDPFAPELADVNRGGDITIVDAVLIQQHLAGLRDDRSVAVTGVTPNASTVEAQLENTGGLGAWDEAQLWIVADGSDQAAVVEGYRAGDPLSPAQLADEIKTAEFDLGPGNQGSIVFDVGDLSPGTYRGLVYTGDDAETFSFQKS